MKKCKKCNVEVNTLKAHCPLCFNELEGTQESSKQDFYPEPKSGRGNDINRKLLLQKIFAFISVGVTALCAFINYITTPTVWWSVVVALSIIYLWMLVRHTIVSRRSAFEKIFFQFVMVVAVIFAINVFVGDGILDEWFWCYTVPISTYVTALALSILLLVNKRRENFTLGVFLVQLLLIAVNIVIVLLPVFEFKVLSILGIITSALVILGILVFSFKNLKNALQRTWHI